MHRINVMIILLAGFLAAGAFWITLGFTAENEALPDNGTQALHDEGYGNSDEEYYGSQDDLVNDEEISLPQENLSTNAR